MILIHFFIHASLYICTMSSYASNILLKILKSLYYFIGLSLILVTFVINGTYMALPGWKKSEKFFLRMKKMKNSCNIIQTWPKRTYMVVIMTKIDVFPYPSPIHVFNKAIWFPTKGFPIFLAIYCGEHNHY